MWNFMLTQSGMATHVIDYTAAVPLLVGGLVTLVALCVGLIALVALQQPDSPWERLIWSSTRPARNKWEGHPFGSRVPQYSRAAPLGAIRPRR